MNDQEVAAHVAVMNENNYQSKAYHAAKAALLEAGLKRCAPGCGCRRVLPVNDFGVDKCNTDSLRSTCKQCSRNARAAYDPEKRREDNRKYYAATRDIRLKQVRAYLARKRADKCETLLASERQKSAMRRAALALSIPLRAYPGSTEEERELNQLIHQERVRLYRWEKESGIPVKQRRGSSALKSHVAAEYIYDCDEFDDLLRHFNAVFTTPDDDRFTLDHVVALANGGEHEPRDNFTPLLGRLNSSKSANDNWTPPPPVFTKHTHITGCGLAVHYHSGTFAGITSYAAA